MSVVEQPEATVSKRLDRTDWTTIAAIGGVVLALHLFGWGVLVLGVAPQHITLGSAGVFGVGLGVTAYLLGVRHAFDADHIAVIDNTTRKLVGEGTRSLSAGFWFSLGHSSVVFGLAFLLAIGVRAIVGPVQDEGSPLLQTLGLVGSLVAGTFLILIGLTNLFAAVGIAKVFRRMRSGDFDEAELERQLEQRGFLARLLRQGDAPGEQAVAPLPGRAAHGPGVRHGHAGGAAGAGRGNGGVHAALVRHHGAACAVRGRDEPVRCARRHLHVEGLRLGVPQAGPQGVLQPDRDRAVGGRRSGHRRHRARRTRWPTASASSRVRSL